MPKETLAHLLKERSRQRGQRIRHWSPVDRDGVTQWKPTSWMEAWQQGVEASAGLLGLGCRRGDPVALVCSTRAEWIEADQATLCAGGIVVAIYPTSAVDELTYILRHSGAIGVMAEDLAQMERIEARRDALPALRFGVLLEGDGSRLPDGWLTMDELRRRGRAELEQSPELVNDRIETLAADDVATLIYTSGTTGQPKGVVLTHGAMTRVARLAAQSMGLVDTDVGVIALPLAHSLQRVSNFAGVYAGSTGWFAPSLERMGEAWQAARPTLVSGVPRIYEKIQARILEAVRASSPGRQRIFHWALAVGHERARREREAQKPGIGLRLRHALADRLVLGKVRARIFGGRVRLMTSGGAPARRDVLEFFHALGLLICEGYGLTETSAPATVNRPERYRFGTVGYPLDGVELRIADDGEVLIRGPGNLREYHANDAATAEAIDDEGWFHSGDLGALDDDGALRITGRKKDIIVTAGGKNIAPQKLEGRLAAQAPISQAVVIGDRRPYLVALIALDPEADNGSDPTARIAEAVARVNETLAPHETIKRFRVLEREMSVETGELTPTLKVKRSFVAERYRDLVEGMYAERSRAAG